MGEKSLEQIMAKLGNICFILSVQKFRFIQIKDEITRDCNNREDTGWLRVRNKKGTRWHKETKGNESGTTEFKVH